MNHNNSSSSIRRRWVLRYGLAFVATAMGFGLRAVLTALAGEGLPTYITFYPLIMAVALLGGVGPGLLATLMTALAVDYWIIPPLHGFAIANLADAVGLAFFTGMGVFMSVFAELYRRARQKAAAHETEIFLRKGRETPPYWSGQGLLISAGLVVSLAILAAAGLQSVRNIRAVAEADKREWHSYVVIQTLERLLSVLKDTETGQRGYLLTGEEKYLEPYLAGLDLVQTNLVSLKQLTRDNVRQQQRLAGIEAPIQEKLVEMQQTIELRRTQGLPAALAVVSTDKGRTLMDQIRKRVTEAQEEEGRRLQQQMVGKSTDASKTLRTLLAGGVLSFLLLVTVFLFLKQENNRRIEAEAKLYATSRYSRSLLEASLDPLVTVNPDGKITDLNKATELVTGVPREQLIGTDFTRYFTEPQNAEAGYQKVLAEGQVRDYPLTIRHTSGRTTDVLYHATVYRNEAGAVQGVFAAARDVTELKRTEMELAQYRDRLEELVKQRTAELEVANAHLQTEITQRKSGEETLRQTAQELERSNRELEQFAYVASHDLQEPLRAVGGYVDLLRHRFPDKLDDKVLQYIAGAASGAVRMQTLITDLLAFSRVGTQGKAFAPADLNALLAQTLDNLQASIQAVHATVTSDPLPRLPVDATQIVQLFQNLIGNALKFRSERPSEVHVGVQQQAGRWLFSVRDNGIGIEPQYFQRIFQIFQRLHTRKAFPGTGIGLAICKKIVERHGGEIWVESQLDQGSTFFFSIPQISGIEDTLHEDKRRPGH
ncbi:MAG: CHASE3 domain-containing protein [Limisphaerales bacterium]